MKLAEALNLRADLQKRITNLRERLIKNAKVQEGDTPSEDPNMLLNELNDNIIELENIIKLINKTNSSTYIDNESISDIIAKRDTLGLKLSILRSFISESADKIERYSNKEIKILSTVNVAEKQKEIDSLSKEYRLIDTKLQGLNWTTDIIS
ncbi:DIP1984 family protein [Clostridium sp. 1001271B_151109_B4]|uniref:DIP1984 family protein n=1 Tax=Clostridium sp. 1001271B_151109_B4 TaxID=2787148 RepID=UPI0018AAD676|nr:DIP1984 family protein [Clostridium sp. 1001271B_151109_B4]